MIATLLATFADARRRFVSAGLLIAVLGAALFYTAEGRVAGAAWESTITLLLALMLAGILRFQSRQRIGWLAVWLGLLSAHIGGTLAAHPWILGLEPGGSSIVDALRLANYPLGALGVIVVLFRADRRVGWRALLDTSVVLGAGSMVIWLAVMEPMLRTSASTGVDLLVQAAYPAMDVLLFGVLVVLMMHLDSKAMPLVLMALGLAGNLVADVVFGAQTVAGSYTPGGVVDSGWLVCFAALAIAPSWPADGEMRISGDEGRLGHFRLAVIGVGAVMVPVLIAARTLGDDGMELVLATAGVVVVLLAIGRMAVFNRDLSSSRERTEAAAAALRHLNDELEEARSDQRRLLDRVHRLVEQERVHLAAELHDRPLQSLAGVGYQLERLRLTAARGDLEKTNQLADAVADALALQLRELRDLMTQIRPPVLDEQGLVGALRDSAEPVMTANPGLRVVVDGDCRRLDGDVETVLYRVAQEAVQNIVRHADATEVSISVRTLGRRAVMTVADDGCGFEADRLTDLLRAGHFGIAGMRERVELLDGVMRVDSSPRGTTFEFDVPAGGLSSEDVQRDMEMAT